MNIRIVVSAEIGSFIAVDPDGSYVVLTLDDTKDIELGDTLSGTFDGVGDLSYRVRNATKGEDVRICLENWDCPPEVAVASLLDMIRQPCAVFSPRARYVSDADGVAGQLVYDIRRA